MYLIFPLFSGQGNTAPFSQSAGSLNKHHHLPHHNSSPGLRSIVHTPTDTLQLSPRPPPPQINNMVFVPTTAHSHVKDSNDTYTPSPSRSPIESPLSSTSSSLQDSLDGSISDTPTSEPIDTPQNTLFHFSNDQEGEESKSEKTDAFSTSSETEDVFSRRSNKPPFSSARNSLVLEDEEEKTAPVPKQDSITEQSATSEANSQKQQYPDQQQHLYQKYLEQQQQQQKPKLPVSILKKPSATSTPMESATPVPNSAISIRQAYPDNNTPSVSKQSSAKRVRFVDDYRYGRKVYNNHGHDPLYSSSRESMGEKSAITPKMKILLTSRGGSALLSQRQQRHPSGKNGLVIPNISAETGPIEPKPPVDESTGSWPQVMQYAHQVTKTPLQEVPTSVAQSSNTSVQNMTDLRDTERHSYASRLLPPPSPPETGQTRPRMPPVDINTSIALDRTPSDDDIGRLWNEITSYFHPTHTSHSATHRQTEKRTKQYEVLPVTYPQTDTHDNQGYLLLPKTLAQGLRHTKSHSASSIRELDSSAVQQKLSSSRPMRCYSMHQPVKLWKKPQNADNSDRLVELSSHTSSGRQSPAARGAHTRQGQLHSLCTVVIDYHTSD